MTQETTLTPNVLPLGSPHKIGHRRNGSSMTAASIKAVAMNGNLVENLLVNLGLRQSSTKEANKGNIRALISKQFLFYVTMCRIALRFNRIIAIHKCALFLTLMLII